MMGAEIRVMPSMTLKGTQLIDSVVRNAWGEELSNHLQFRCKICPGGTGEFADVVCAGAWYGKDGYPDFTERA
jgi:coenzyme F420 hydrogenase subunit beta